MRPAAYVLVYVLVVVAVAVAFGSGRIRVGDEGLESVAWGNRVFYSREEISSFLSARGVAYEEWARKHPGAAARVEHAGSPRHIALGWPPEFHGRATAGDVAAAVAAAVVLAAVVFLRRRVAHGVEAVRVVARSLARATRAGARLATAQLRVAVRRLRFGSGASAAWHARVSSGTLRGARATRKAAFVAKRASLSGKAAPVAAAQASPAGRPPRPGPQSRTAPAPAPRPPTSEPLVRQPVAAAAVRAGRAGECEIRVWHGYVKSHFYAVRLEDQGMLAESPSFRRRDDVRVPTPAIQAAHDELVSRLVDTGWDPLPRASVAAARDEWYAQRFRLRQPAA